MTNGSGPHPKGRAKSKVVSTKEPGPAKKGRTSRTAAGATLTARVRGRKAAPRR